MENHGKRAIFWSLAVCILLITTVFLLLTEGSVRSVKPPFSAYAATGPSLLEGVTIDDIVVDAERGFIRYTLHNRTPQALICGETTEIEVYREQEWRSAADCGGSGGADADYLDIEANSSHTVYQLLAAGIELPAGEYRMIKNLGYADGSELPYTVVGSFILGE